MVGAAIIQKLRRRDVQSAANFFNGTQRGILRRVLQTRQRTYGNAELPGEGAVRLLALRFPNLPLNGLCGVPSHLHI